MQSTKSEAQLHISNENGTNEDLQNATTEGLNLHEQKENVVASVETNEQESSHNLVQALDNTPAQEGNTHSLVERLITKAIDIVRSKLTLTKALDFIKANKSLSSNSAYALLSASINAPQAA